MQYLSAVVSVIKAHPQSLKVPRSVPYLANNISWAPSLEKHATRLASLKPSRKFFSLVILLSFTILNQQFVYQQQSPENVCTNRNVIRLVMSR